MNKLICQKCGGEISNQFHATLSFCTNCGESLSLPEEVTLVLPKIAQPQKPRNQFPVILMTSLFTSVFLLTLVGVGFYMFFPRSSPKNPIVQNDAETIPTPRKRQPGSLSVADISEISSTYFRYEGLLYGGEKNRSVTNYGAFRSDGTVHKIDGVINYENQKKVGEKVQKFRGTITTEQFEQLAKVLIENDFLNENDAKDRITDSGDYRLKIKYAGGEKEIITSNTGKNTPEIKAILEAFNNLQSQTLFIEVK